MSSTSTTLLDDLRARYEGQRVHIVRDSDGRSHEAPLNVLLDSAGNVLFGVDGYIVEVDSDEITFLDEVPR